ncbi:MAG: HPr family phosphocarrier protein [Lachnospiraceae bacterium]|nr:HPr family phosphocarrier protein [Lachnospiraceae bacterium]MCI9185639.1 HPr family phosphocarrier protein [Lachnospiraceae bacterium]
MNKFKVKFKDPEEVVDFVNRVERYPFAMDLSRGSVVVDAKSLLGIMVLGLNQVVSLSIYADECTQLCQDIEKFIAI